MKPIPNGAGFDCPYKNYTICVVEENWILECGGKKCPLDEIVQCPICKPVVCAEKEEHENCETCLKGGENVCQKEEAQVRTEQDGPPSSKTNEM